MKLTDTKRRALGVLAETQGVLSADNIGARMRPRLTRLGVTSSLRSAEAEGLVVRLPPRDQWSTAKWSITPAGRSLLAPKEAPDE